METKENQIVKVSEPIFKKIALKNGGQEGLILNYAEGHGFYLKETPRHEIGRPIHKELIDLFDKLKKYLLIAIGNCHWDSEGVFEMLKSQTIIKGIAFKDSRIGFIGGTVSGAKYKGALMEIEEYEMVEVKEYGIPDKLEDLVKEIKKETMLYMNRTCSPN